MIAAGPSQLAVGECSIWGNFDHETLGLGFSIWGNFDHEMFVFEGLFGYFYVLTGPVLNTA